MFRQLVPLSILSVVLTSFGCEQPSSFNLETPDPKLVVVSNFTRDKAVQVFVSKSQSVLDGEETTYVLDAKVEIYEDDDYLETLDLVEPIHNENGVPYYTTRNLIPKVNTTYTIQVNASCCAPAMAKSRIPNSISFTSVSISDFTLTENPETEELLVHYQVRMSFMDPSEEKNYYHISLLQQIHEFSSDEGDTSIVDSYHLSLVFDPTENGNGRVTHVSGGLLLEDNIANDGEVIEFEMPLNFKLKKGEELLGQLFLELRAVTEEYYRYFAGLSRQKEGIGSPFTEPVILYDNIDGGVGVFAGYNSSLDSLFIQ